MLLLIKTKEKYVNKSLKIIDNCISYIENNLKNKITLETISKEIGVSKFHLHRMFKGLTNQTLREYINHRKLSHSLNALILTDLRIIDIAIDYGFEYEQNYIRSFKKVFGLTPLKARKSNFDIDIVEPLSINDFSEVDSAVIFKPSFVVRPEFKLIGVKHKIYLSDDEELAASHGKDFYYNRKQEIQGIINPHIYFGYTYWDKDEYDYTYYIPSAQVVDNASVPDNMVCVTISKSKYAVFKLVGFFNPDDINGSKLSSIMDYMYGKWIADYNYVLANNYRFELIDTNISKDNYCELNLYIPVKSTK